MFPSNKTYIFVQVRQVIGDKPAMAKLLCHSGHGAYKGCLICPYYSSSVKILDTHDQNSPSCYAKVCMHDMIYCTSCDFMKRIDWHYSHFAK